LITPGTFDAISSQIDIAPTLLGLLRLPYSSRFFGQDAFKDGTRNQRAYFANQQTVGLYKDGKVVELYPNRNIRVVDAKTNAVLDPTDHAQEVLIEEAIRSYQHASFAFKNGLLKRPLPEASKP
jgi:arylsulfatase A-like enzyme